jgi:hypothetical protein
MFSEAHRSGVMVMVIVRVGIAVSVAVAIDSGVTTVLPQPDRSIVKMRATEMSRMDFFMV